MPENKLIINNDISQLILDNETVMKTLYHSLRFREPGYFHSPAYKLFIRSRGQRGWDGHVEFFNKLNGKFMTGLLPEIAKALSTLGIKLEIEDNRTEKIEHVEITPSSIDGVVLHDYQVDIANKAWKMERGIIKAATSAGKTLLFTALIKSIPENTPTLVLFRSKTLASQTYQVFKQNGVKNAGLLHGESWNPNIIMCATIQSHAHYEELLDKFKVLIVDECHEFTTNNSIKVFKKMKNCRYRFAFSATPWPHGDDVKKYKLKSWFGPVLGDIGTKYLQERNILSDSNCVFHVIDRPENIDMEDYAASYEKGVICNQYFHQKIKDIIDSYESGRILILVERLDHGDALAKMIPGSYWVQGKDDEETRKFVIDKLTKSDPGEKVCAISSKIFTTGINIFLHAIVNAAGYKSDIMTIQRIGRGLRKAEDKERLDYHDFYFMNNHYLEEHSKARITWLKAEGHKIELQ